MPGGGGGMVTGQIDTCIRFSYMTQTEFQGDKCQSFNRDARPFFLENFIITLYNVLSVHQGMFSTSGEQFSTSEEVLSTSGEVFST